jgi:DnaA-like protein
MYCPRNGLASGPIRLLYANKGIPSIYSRHIRQLVEYSIASVFNVSPYEMHSPRRCGRKIAFARQIAMYLAHVGGGLSLREVGRLFSRNRSTVAHACAAVEDRRDDPLLDRCLTFLEVALATGFGSRNERMGDAR